MNVSKTALRGLIEDLIEILLFQNFHNTKILLDSLTDKIVHADTTAHRNANRGLAQWEEPKVLWHSMSKIKTGNSEDWLIFENSTGL